MSDPYVEYIVTTPPEDTFAVPFQFWEKQDLNVNIDGTSTADFTAVGAGDPAGGSIILSTPVENVTLSIQRFVPGTRFAEFPIAGPFRIEALNDEFDRLFAVVNDRTFVADNKQTTWDQIVGKPDVVVWDDIYPIGSVHLSFTNVPPPRGTWTKLANGTFLISANGPIAIDETGGEAAVALQGVELPSHTHQIIPPEVTTSENGEHTHGLNREGRGSGGTQSVNNGGSDVQTGSAGAHTHTVTIPEFTSAPQGLGVAHNNLPPYIGVTMWRRTG